MNGILSRFRSLGWKLTLSYTLVTVAALLVVEGLVLVLLQVLVVDSDLLPSMAAQIIVRDAAPQARPYLEGAQPDLQALDRWLQDVTVTGIPTRDSYGRDVRLAPSIFSTGGQARLLVLDAQGRLLDELPRNSAPAPGEVIGEAYDLARVPMLDRLLPVALSGESDAARLFARRPDGMFTVAAPVRAQDGHVLGVFVFSGILIANQSFSSNLFGLLAGSALGFTIAAGLTGTLFGFLTARVLTRRLDVVARSAAAWGRGDFSARVGDRSADEIGQLGRALDEVARELDSLIETRQQLATLEERNRLARDLHDSVKQQVFAISMNLGTAQELWERDPSAARARLDAAAGLARQSQRELGALIQALRPLQLQGQGLAQGIREYMQSWEKQSGIATIYQAQGDATPALEAEQALFRVVQEALANIARHSGATAATVTLAMRPDGTDLHIRDNGRGFDAGQPPRGLGLSSMHERVQALGGTFTIESGAQGTHIAVHVPCIPVP